MVTPSAGAIVLVPFPFSDLSAAKLRPAIVVADAGRGDWILCQVTSRSYGDPIAVEIRDEDCRVGTLRITSWARPGKLFTANRSLIVREVARLQPQVLSQLLDAVVRIVRPPAP